MITQNNFRKQKTTGKQLKRNCLHIISVLNHFGVHRYSFSMCKYVKGHRASQNLASSAKIRDLGHYRECVANFVFSVTSKKQLRRGDGEGESFPALYCGVPKVCFPRKRSKTSSQIRLYAETFSTLVLVSNPNQKISILPAMFTTVKIRHKRLLLKRAVPRKQDTNGRLTDGKEVERVPTWARMAPVGTWRRVILLLLDELTV